MTQTYDLPDNAARRLAAEEDAARLAAVLEDCMFRLGSYTATLLLDPAAAEEADAVLALANRASEALDRHAKTIRDPRFNRVPS